MSQNVAFSLFWVLNDFKEFIQVFTDVVNGTLIHSLYFPAHAHQLIFLIYKFTYDGIDMFIRLTTSLVISHCNRRQFYRFMMCCIRCRNKPRIVEIEWNGYK